MKKKFFFIIISFIALIVFVALEIISRNVTPIINKDDDLLGNNS